MLQRGYLSVLEARSLDEFRGGLVRFTEKLGFATVSATTVVDQCAGAPRFLNVDNTPAAYRGGFADQNRGRRCPVAQHCKRSSLPIIWNRTTYLDAGQHDLWEHQASFGYCYGISLALHMPKGLHFMIGIDRDQALPACSDELSRTVADLHLLAVHAYEAAERLHFPYAPELIDGPTLTPRELECLRWTMEGKTAWELGRILGIAEQTAVRHLFNASKKLECVNKHQAVLKALRMKLIW